MISVNCSRILIFHMSSNVATCLDVSNNVFFVHYNTYESHLLRFATQTKIVTFRLAARLRLSRTISSFSNRFFQSRLCRAKLITRCIPFSISLSSKECLDGCNSSFSLLSSGDPISCVTSTFCVPNPSFAPFCFACVPARFKICEWLQIVSWFKTLVGARIP